MERPRVTLGDVAVAAAATGVLVIEVVGELDDQIRGPVVLSLLLALLMGGILILRRRLPLTTYAINGVALTLQATFFFAPGTAPFANLVAIYAVGLHATRRQFWLALPLAAVGIPLYFRHADEPAVLPYLVVLLWFVTWGAGTQVEQRRAQEATTRVETARAAIAEERARLARDLHDQVGHAVTVMLVQAGAARQVLTTDPERARIALAAIEEVGRATMEDLDRVLGQLRDAPDRTLDQRLDDVVIAVRAAGLAVDQQVDVGGELSDEIAVVVHRLVQESLTNTLRHAHATRARVVVTTDAREVTVTVSDDGAGPTSTSVPGRGLVGMDERVTALGGRLTHGPATPRGFRVAATIPRRETATSTELR